MRCNKKKKGEIFCQCNSLIFSCIFHLVYLCPLLKSILQLQLSVDCHSPVKCSCGGTCYPTSLASKWHHTHTRCVVAPTFKVLSNISAMMGRSDAVSVTKQQSRQCISAPPWLQKKTAMFKLFLITGCGSNSSRLQCLSRKMRFLTECVGVRLFGPLM